MDVYVCIYVHQHIYTYLRTFLTSVHNTHSCKNLTYPSSKSLSKRISFTPFTLVIFSSPSTFFSLILHPSLRAFSSPPLPACCNDSDGHWLLSQGGAGLSCHLRPSNTLPPSHCFTAPASAPSSHHPPPPPPPPLYWWCSSQLYPFNIFCVIIVLFQLYLLWRLIGVLPWMLLEMLAGISVCVCVCVCGIS